MESVKTAKRLPTTNTLTKLLNKFLLKFLILFIKSNFNNFDLLKIVFGNILTACKQKNMAVLPYFFNFYYFGSGFIILFLIKSDVIDYLIKVFKIKFLLQHPKHAK